MDFVLFQGEDELVRVLKTEIDPVGIDQFAAGDFLAIDENAMAAIEVFHQVIVAVLDDASVAARGAIIAQHQRVVGLAANRIRQRLNGDAAAVAGGADHHQCRGAGRH
jgi:hypothetical protein